ncbi:MAG: hypothetical protein U0T82_11000 [Bacteroidales bacterium]
MDKLDKISFVKPGSKTAMSRKKQPEDKLEQTRYTQQPLDTLDYGVAWNQIYFHQESTCTNWGTVVKVL